MITQALGESATSQLVKAYRASMVLSGDTSFCSVMLISTPLLDMSSTFLILILPLSLALMIESIRLSVVCP